MWKVEPKTNKRIVDLFIAHFVVPIKWITGGEKSEKNNMIQILISYFIFHFVYVMV